MDANASSHEHRMELVETSQACSIKEGSIPLSIVSNSPLLREGLAMMLGQHLNIQLLGSYASEHPITPPLPNPAGHVVLIDGALGPENALRWIHYWHNRSPECHIVLLEVPDNPALILRYIEAGLSGYTVTGSGVGEVANAIRYVRRGAVHCSPEMMRHVFQRVAELHGHIAQNGASIPLTTRELEVLRYIALDYSNSEIAAALVIEVRTVKHHVHNILEKLNLKHRWDAARVAAERGWLDQVLR